jgi:prepilin-type N-terminal cleavage/methylation domain-containing protein
VRPPRANRGNRPGFTLLELVAALSLTGLVLLGAWRLLDQLADGRDQLRRENVSSTARANGTRLLRALVSRAESPSDATVRFSGNESSASFAGWCDVPAGWLERCDVALAVTSSADSSTITATLDRASPAPITLAHLHGRASLLYFDAAGGGSRGWRTVWSSSLTLPSAIGVAIPGDTIVLPIGTKS